MRENEDVFIDRVSAELRAPVAVRDGFDARVMAAVRAEHAAGARPAPPSARAGAWRWWLRPRVVRVPPLAGVGIAAGVVALAVLAGARLPRARERGRHEPAAVVARVPAVPGAGRVRPVAATRFRATRFVLAAPTARSVALIGDFNDWDADSIPLRHNPDGTWTALVPLAPGRYEYAFKVDGARVVVDPAAPRVASEFGAANSVLTVDGDGP